MRNGRFFHTITTLQNVPRWDEYAPHFEDNTASHSYRVALFTLIAAHLEKDMFHRDIDVEKAVCKALFHDINETVTGSIKHNTKKDPMIREHIEKTEHEANVMIVGYLSRSLRPDFTEFIVNAEDQSVEGRLVQTIDTLDAFLFCKRESPYSTFFTDTMHTLVSDLQKTDFQSVLYILRAVEQEDALYTFLHQVLMLDRVRRWKGKFNTIADNDATHMFRASCFAVFNVLVEKIKYGVSVDLLQAVAKTLCHDIVEATTGDVLGPIKHANPHTKRAFEEYEVLASEKLLKMLPDALQDTFREYMVLAKNDTYEGKMVDIVDKMDALIKSGMERRQNPMEYELSYQKQRRSLQRKFETPSVLFFLSYILHDLQDPLFEEEIVETIQDHTVSPD